MELRYIISDDNSYQTKYATAHIKRELMSIKKATTRTRFVNSLQTPKLLFKNI